MEKNLEKTIRNLSEEHKGKISDKWSSYLDEYERLLSPLRNEPLSMLEIGIQNGGSLEIWEKYFPKAERIIGCDINPKCKNLSFEDPRIRLVVDDANTDHAQTQILEHGGDFDIIIDDGSHTSGDIVKSFARYFPFLKKGGLFLAEDLHCGYWEDFQGGLFDPLSCISFFKDLADLVNYEHWGVPESRVTYLKAYSEYYQVPFNETDLAAIQSVEFLNSICVVKKKTDLQQGLGERCLSGVFADVFPVDINSIGKGSSGNITPDQTGNKWSHSTLFQRGEKIARASQEIDRLQSELERIKHTLSERENSLSWKLTSPLRRISNLLLRH